MPNCKEAVTIALRQLLDVADGADEAVRQGQQVDAVFLYGRIFMHDEDVVEEIVDGADAFRQDIGCGGGFNIRRLLERSRDGFVYGIDPIP